MTGGLSENMKQRAGAKGGEVLGRIYRRLVSCYLSHFCAWAILACGIYLRIKQYAFNRSLWFDEALLGTYVAEHSFADLLRPEMWDNVDPVGFLWVLKYCVRIFGNCEYALRLFPLICGLVACVVFYQVAKKCLHPSAVPLALILFSISDKLIYYASEAKPYSGDVLMTLLIYRAVLVYHPRRAAFKWLAIAGLGIIGPWFSYPSVFVTASVITVLFFGAVREKKWKTVLAVLTITIAVIAGILIYYCIFLKQISSNVVMRQVWMLHFGTLIPWGMQQLLCSFQNIQALVVGQKLGGLSVIAAATGMFVFLKENRKIGLIFILPIAVAYLASTLGKYPLAERLILFYAPALYCLIAQGMDRVWRFSLKNGYPIFGIIIAGLLLSVPVQNGLKRLSQPQEREEIKPVLDYIERYHRPSDVLYVYYGAIPALNYYTKVWVGRERYHWEPLRVWFGVDRNWSPWVYTSDIEHYRQEKRVWFLFAHDDTPRGLGEKKLYLDYLSITAKALDAYEARRASVFLYDLSASPSS